MFVGSEEFKFANKLLGYLQETDYRVADNDDDREEIYRLRYDAYIREGSINPNSSGLFHDAYDDFDNCWIFGVFVDEKLISSIRFHVISPENRKGPALDVFPDIVGPMIDKGMTLIDPTRFVSDLEATKEYPELPFLTLRVASMACEYFSADYCLATIRKEHQAFYRRVYKAEALCEPRPYPTLNAPISLMKANVSEIRDKLMRRYPIFESSFTERRMIFDRSSNGMNRGFDSIPAYIPGAMVQV